MSEAFGNKKTFEKNKRSKGAPKGSKYAKKGRPAKKAVKPLERDTPVYQYLCQCHDLEAVKKPCEHTAEDRQDKKFSQSTLGTWTCSVSKKKTKVRRVKNKPVEETPDEGSA